MLLHRGVTLQCYITCLYPTLRNSLCWKTICGCTRTMHLSITHSGAPKCSYKRRLPALLWPIENSNGIVYGERRGVHWRRAFHCGVIFYMKLFHKHSSPVTSCLEPVFTGVLWQPMARILSVIISFFVSRAIIAPDVSAVFPDSDVVCPTYYLVCAKRWCVLQ